MRSRKLRYGTQDGRLFPFSTHPPNTPLCPLYNYWYLSFKLIDKVQQEDGRYKKVYEKSPKTPYQSLLESSDVSEAYKVELWWRKVLYNPVVLNRGLNEAVEELLCLNREKVYAENAS
jgi:hypothetical protein